METVLGLITGAASWGVRWNAYVFLRLLPFGSIYLPRIYTCFAISLATSWLVLSRLDPIAASQPKTAQPSSRERTHNHVSTRIIQLIAGTARPRDPFVSVCNLVINALCVLMSIDFVYRAHHFYPSDGLSFSRMGYVGDETARIALRSAGPGVIYENISLNLYTNDSLVQTVRIPYDGTDTDSTSHVQLDGLLPAQHYKYNTTAGHSGYFTTQANSSDMKRFTLLSTSCQKPNWPYSPLNHPLRLEGLEGMERYMLTNGVKAEMMLFLGDFIYSDLPKPLASYTLPYYRQLYRQIYASPSWSPLLRSIPWIHMFDDHEIINDFAPASPHAPLYRPAMQAYREYQSLVNPPPVVSGSNLDPRCRWDPSTNPSADTEKTYFTYNIGQVAFFVLDNRSYRDNQPQRMAGNSTAGHGTQTMLGKEQLRDVKRWIEKEGSGEGRLLVLVSGVPVTRNWSEGRDEFDSWAGYLDERQEILELLWSVGGAIIISGDRHEHATTLLPPPSSSSHPASSAVIEFSTSPLSFFHQPWAREHIPHPPTDISVYHQWRGNSRFGVFDFDTEGNEMGVRFRLVVDGKQDWECEWYKGKGLR